MTLTITLPEPLTAALKNRAAQEHKPAVDLALKLLSDALEEENTFPTLEEIVAQIKATPPDPTAIHPAQGSLGDALASLATDPDFDVEAWQRQWDEVEAEMKARDRSDAIADAIREGQPF
jgi:plasmid stability protein